MSTPEGRVRLEAYEERVDQAIADRVEAADKASGEEMQPRPALEAMGHEEEVKFEPSFAAPATPSYRHAPQPGDGSAPVAEPDQGTGPRDETIDNDIDGEDADMGAVQEEESEEEIGIVHEDLEDEVSTILLAQLGQSSKSYRREFRKASKHLVSEIYSPPRITREVKNGRYRNLAPGFALDLTVVDPEDGKPWDFCSKAKRDKARRMQREQRPILLIGSPMCTMFSSWQHLNFSKSNDKEAMRRAYAGACVHMEFVAEQYHEQVEGNRYFLHEHPRYATSWQLRCMEQLQELPGVEAPIADVQ